ncbi:hypothetical protein [Floridanema evergladense]|uniref:Yip1 domain-containing protein n=1 Tax=Floridaenema evergladense BLCC-F167 TaxID=3153639 RepID=A0ABV4WKY0_9CYAN
MFNSYQFSVKLRLIIELGLWTGRGLGWGKFKRILIENWYQLQKTHYMQKVRNSPLLSLLLLFVTYIIVGWVLYENTMRWGLCNGELFGLTFSFKCKWWVVILTGALILLLAETLAAPLSNLRKVLSLTFQSDTRAFIALVTLAFFTSLLIIWINFVAYIVLVVASALRARLEMAMIGFRDWQAFFTLAIVSLSGFLLGWIGAKLTFWTNY